MGGVMENKESVEVNEGNLAVIKFLHDTKKIRAVFAIDSEGKIICHFKKLLDLEALSLMMMAFSKSYFNKMIKGSEEVFTASPPSSDEPNPISG